MGLADMRGRLRCTFVNSGHINLETGVDAPPISVADNQRSLYPFGARYYGMDFLWITWLMKVRSTNRGISKLTGASEQQQDDFLFLFPGMC